jgi:enoyl-CoA hydratase
MSDASVRVEIESGVATVTLDAPPLNLIDGGMYRGIVEAFEALAIDERVICAILTGAGERAFSAGGDFKESGADVPEQARWAVEHDTWRAVAGFPKPLIGALNGDALGRGLQLALCCDVRLAADHARFALPEVSFGFIPASGGTQRLPRVVGRAKALEMVLTAGRYDAAAAVEMGLVSRALPAGELMAEAQRLAALMATRGPIALRYAKEAVLRGLDGALDAGMRIEADLSFVLQTTEDRSEGIKAFLEKREPRFRGR